MPYLGVLGSNFEKLLSYLRIVSSDLCYCKVWCKNEKYLFWFGYFWTRIWKYYCHNWNHCPRICLIVTFCERIKYLNLGPKVSYLGIFGLEFYKTIVILLFNSYSEFRYRVRFFYRSVKDLVNKCISRAISLLWKFAESAVY